MIFFRYTHYLEEQVKELKVMLEDSYKQNDKLLDHILLLCQPKAAVTAGDMAKSIPSQPVHQIKRGEGHASCSCGWNFISDDPAELQNKISSHYRESNPPLKSTSRKSWPQIKNALQSKALEEPPQ